MEQESVDLRRYVGLVLSWWWVLALGVMVGGVAAYFISINQAPVYQASTVILVQQSQSALPTVSDLQASQSLARTYQELITTRPVLEEVVQELELSRSANDLKGATAVAVIRDTQLLRLTVNDNDPQSAANIANTLAQVFISRTTEARLEELARLQEAAAAQGLADPTALIAVQLEAIGILSHVEEAIAPTSPILPRTRTNIMIAGILGGLVALGIVVVVENLTDTVRSPELLERTHGLSNLGFIPFWRSGEVPQGQVVVSGQRQSHYAEAYRQVRANMEFATAGQQARVFMVASPGEGEGKTSSVANLAAAIAQTGKTVIVVDADLRRPDLHRYFGLHRGQEGLSKALALPESVARDMLQTTPVPGVLMLASGPPPPNPGELLGLPRMASLLQQLREEADVVLLDSAPVLVAADSVILAAQVDGVVLVVDTERTRMGALRVAVESLRKADTRILGVVFNKLKPKRFSYGRQYPYYYHYYYSDYSRPSPESGNGAPDLLGPGDQRTGHVTGWVRKGWSRVVGRRSKSG